MKPPLSWPELQSILPEKVYNLRVTLPNFVYDDEVFEKSLPALSEIVTSYSDDFEGDVYGGQMRHSTQIREGQGVYISKKDGWLYEGYWKDRMRNGKGRYIWANGDVYEGSYKDGLRHGKGTNIWSDGHTYIGNWVDSRREGKGLMVYPDGSKYEGTWKNDQPAGQGKDGHQHLMIDGKKL